MVITKKMLLSLMLVICSPFVLAEISQAVQAYQQGDINTAKSLFQAESEQVEAKIYLARIAMNQKQDLDQAEEWIDAAVKQADNHGEAHFVRGLVMGEQASESIFSALSYAKKSKSSFLRAVTIDPDSVEYQDGLFQFYLQAPEIAGGDMKLAKQQIDIIRQLDPRAGLLAQIDLSASQEDMQQVAEIIDQGVQDFPEHAEFYFLKGYLSFQRKDYAKANHWFEKAAEVEPADESSARARLQAMFQLGNLAAISQDNVKQGITALKEYLVKYRYNEALPSKEWAKFRLANLFELDGNKRKAKAIYQGLLSSKDHQLLDEVKKII